MVAARRVFALTVHANYACRHTGACCTAGWPIPVEPDRRARLGAAVLLPDSNGTCKFYDAAARRCRVHLTYGETALPSSCAHFPRRALIDDRGVFITLSHFCPTAAAGLVRATDRLAIVEAPFAFPGNREYEGLDARGAWPPLVKAGLLFDLAGYSAWEEFLVARLGEREGTPCDALGHIALAGEELRRWKPADQPFQSMLAALAPTVQTEQAARAAWQRYQPLTRFDAYERLLTFIPDGLDRPSVSAGMHERPAIEANAWGALGAAAKRYLAAKAFGSWAAYEASGVRTAIAELVLSELVLRVEAARAMDRQQRSLDEETMIAAVREADRILIHLVDRGRLMTWLSHVESLDQVDCQATRPTKNGPSRSR
jgi:hypothetical protein